MNMSTYPASVSRNASSRRALQTTRLEVEALETRQLLTCNVISGYVYHDANANGWYDYDESPIANSRIELRNADGVVVGTTTTDADGYYEFSTDSTLNSTESTHTQTLVFEEGPTNFELYGELDLFDEAMGELLGVEIIISGQITSNIRVENRDPVDRLLTGVVDGSIHLEGPGFFTTLATNAQYEEFYAGAFDGTIDFAGGSGMQFGNSTAEGSESFLLTDPFDLAAYVGEGTMTFIAIAQSDSTVIGGGNLAAMISSFGSVEITVVYHYRSSNCLRNGDYTIVQTRQPKGYLDGRESSGEVVDLYSIGSDTIGVTLAGEDLVNNNFGEVKAASISGCVYEDRNKSGFKDPGERGIRGVFIALVGYDDRGELVSRTVRTNSAGVYTFANLRPGTYDINERQPPGYDDGIDMAGNLGGIAENDRILAIVLQSGAKGKNYCFAEWPRPRGGQSGSPSCADWLNELMNQYRNNRR